MSIDPASTHAIDIQLRRAYHNLKAEAASGVSPPDGEDHESDQRDADGRQPFEMPMPKPKTPTANETRKSKDHRNRSGKLLDETG